MPDDDLARWYADVRDALTEKLPADVARELAGLVDCVADEPDPGPAVPEDAEPSHYVVGVSFSKNHTCLDYAVDRVHETADGDVHVEAVKTPASGTHRYVEFTHPPDPRFDAAALRARLLGAVDEVHREHAALADPPSGFADVWEQL